MKTREKSFRHQSRNPFEANASLLSLRDSQKTRFLLGLPDLYDVDHNCINMHNEEIEDEVQYISKQLGNVYSSKTMNKGVNPGIGNTFGF